MKRFKMISKTRPALFAGLCGMLALTGCLKEDVNEAIGRENPEISLYAMRDLFSGATTTLDAGLLRNALYTRALVVSDPLGKNLPDGHIAVQNTWRNQHRGMLVKVDDATQYRFGDSVQIYVRGATLSRESGRMVLSGPAEGDIAILNRGNPVVARSVSIALLLDRFGEYESTFVDVTADLETEPAAGTPIAGSRPLIDGEGNRINLFTSEQAAFANEPVAPSATFRGVAFREGDDMQLRLQNYDGMAYPSGKIYPGWPETFESPSWPKGSYNMPAIGNNVILATGEWHLYQAIIASTAGRDRIVSGANAVRMQQNRSDNEYVQMNFDLPNGASKVTFWYGAYWTDRSSTFILEYSQDQGSTWQQIGDAVSDAHKTTESMDSKQAVFLMNIQGPVRFRITKLGLGPSSNTVENGRLGLDDIAVFRSY